jgi:uncharacterized membrane protein
MSAMSGHDHAERPSSTRGAGALVAAVVLLALATVVGLVVLWPSGTDVADADAGDRIRGTVTRASLIPCSRLVEDPDQAQAEQPDLAKDDTCFQVAIRIDQGPERGETVRLFAGNDQADYTGVGQHVVLFRASGEDLELDLRYQLVDVQRGSVLLWLGALFVLAVVALGRWRGALSLVGLGLSVLVLVKFLVPALLAGESPLLTAVVGASAVMMLVLVLAHGPNIRTATAIAGTGLSLVLIVVLSTLFAELAGLTGLTSDEAVYVRSLFGQVDLRGLFLAGIVIGALGILDDITVTQVSTVWELRAADPSMPRPALYAAALRVGRDHIASTVNTLLLAYAGASMPLLVIFTVSGDGLIGTVTNAVVAEEVVRTLVGSIGLVAAVPVTTALAAAMCPAEGETSTPLWMPRRARNDPADEPQSWGAHAEGAPEPG